MLHADAQAISQKATQIRALREWKSWSAAGPGPQTGANICHKTQHKVGESTKGEAVIRQQTQDYNSLHLFGKQWASRKGRTLTLDRTVWTLTPGNLINATLIPDQLRYCERTSFVNNLCLLAGAYKLFQSACNDPIFKYIYSYVHIHDCKKNIYYLAPPLLPLSCVHVKPQGTVNTTWKIKIAAFKTPEQKRTAPSYEVISNPKPKKLVTVKRRKTIYVFLTMSCYIHNPGNTQQKRHQTTSRLNQRTWINGVTTLLQWESKQAFLALQSFSKNSL